MIGGASRPNPIELLKVDVDDRWQIIQDYKPQICDQTNLAVFNLSENLIAIYGDRERVFSGLVLNTQTLKTKELYGSRVHLINGRVPVHKLDNQHYVSIGFDKFKKKIMMIQIKVK